MENKTILEHLQDAEIEKLWRLAFDEYVQDCRSSFGRKKTPAQIQSAAKALMAIPMGNQNPARIWETGEYIYIISPRTVVRAINRGPALKPNELPVVGAAEKLFVVGAAEKLFDADQSSGSTVSDIDWPFFLAEATADFKKKRKWIGLYRKGAEPYGYAVDAASLVPALTILGRPERVWTWGPERSLMMRMENDSVSVVTLLKKEEKEVKTA